MKRFVILAVCLVMATSTAQACQYNQYASATTPTSSYSETIKIYDSNGSLQGYYKPHD